MIQNENKIYKIKFYKIVFFFFFIWKYIIFFSIMCDNLQKRTIKEIGNEQVVTFPNPFTNSCFVILKYNFVQCYVR